MTKRQRKRRAKDARRTPRRKRMRRAARLQSAVAFLRGFRGEDLVRGYTSWFGVDLGAAMVELPMLGVHLDPEHIERIRATIREKERIGRLRNEQRKARASEALCDEFVARSEDGRDWDFMF